MTKGYILSLILAAAPFCATAQVTVMYGEDMDKGWGDKGAVVTPYVSFPEKYLATYAGNEIKSVKIGVNKAATNCYVYIKRSAEDSQPLYRQKVDRLEEGWNEITLDTPYPVAEGEKLAVGYKGTFAEAEGVGLSNETFTEATAVYYNSHNKWLAAPGSVCIALLIDGDKLPENDLWISPLTKDNDADLTDNTLRYKGYVKNRGVNSVNSYNVEVYLDGEPVTTVEGVPVEAGGRAIFSFDVSSDIVGSHSVEACVTGVNGGEDSYPGDNVASASFSVRDPRFVRKVVCEEYTGTWCGWCVRGFVGLELMKEKHPDTFFPICVHGNDEMEIKDMPDSDYSEYRATVPGAPYCNVNRRFKGDPFYDIQNFYKLETTSESHFCVEASGKWNGEKSAIEVKTTFFTDADLKNQELAMAYTVVEDGVTGYFQTNYYSGNEAEFYGWEKKASVTNDVVFNDVARAIVGGYKGMSCFSGNVEALVPQTHEYTVAIPASVVDKDNVSVIAQLIDSKSGFIVNAARVDMTGNVAVGAVEESMDDIKVRGGLLEVTAEDAKVSVYDAGGRLVKSFAVDGTSSSAIAPGFYIVVVERNGTVTKHAKILI